MEGGHPNSDPFETIHIVLPSIPWPNSLSSSLPSSPPALLSCNSPPPSVLTMSSRPDRQNEHSKPMPIPINVRRGRSHSVSESSSSEESCSPSSPVSPLQSPLTSAQPRVATVSPGTSPILSYFLSQSPKTASATTFPFRRGFGSAVFDGTWLSLLTSAVPTTSLHDTLYFSDDSEPDLVTPPAHPRRATTSWASAERFVPPPQPAAPVPDHSDRAAGLLRRLSLGGPALRVRDAAFSHLSGGLYRSIP